MERDRELGEVQAQLEQSKSTIAQLNWRIDRLEDHDAALQREIERYQRIKAMAEDVHQVYQQLHHLGDYDVVEEKEGVWDIRGTLMCYLGLHPTDYDRGLQPRFHRFATGFPDGVVTWDWREVVQIGHPFYSKITQPPGFPYTFNYPDVSLSGFVVRAFDPNPPNPTWHSAGLMEVVNRFRTSIFNPQYVVENQHLEDTLNAWYDRVGPLIVKLNTIVNMLLERREADMV